MDQPVLHQVLVFLHVVSAAYWFGVAAGVPRRLRAHLAILDKAPSVRAISDASLKRDAQTLVWAPIVTVAVAMVLTGMVGGFTDPNPRFHVAASVGLLWAGGSYLTGRSLESVVELGLSAEDRKPAITAGVGVCHLLWVVLLVLMVTTVM